MSLIKALEDYIDRMPRIFGFFYQNPRKLSLKIKKKFEKK